VQRMKARTALMIVVILGVALELVVSGISATAEAWDASSYWSVGYPVAVILCGALGYSSPTHWQNHGPLLLGAQWLTMALGKAPGPHMIVGLAFAAALSVPCVVAGWVGAHTARHFTTTDDGEASPPPSP